VSVSTTTADRLPARTDAKAKARFLHFLNQTVQVVCREAQWLATPEAGGWSAFTVPHRALALKTDDSHRLYLQSMITFEYGDHPNYPGERKVNTLEYSHIVGEDENVERQLFSWEWDPTGWPYPHVHVDRGQAAAKGFGKLHVPTGRVFLEQVVAFLVRDLGVVPQRDDWEELLGANVRRVSRFATWGGLPQQENAN
jgi:hypothetical protein